MRNAREEHSLLKLGSTGGAALVVGLVLVVCACGPERGAANLLLIVVDTLRADRLGCAIGN